jgi:hypothetical protein
MDFQEYMFTYSSRFTSCSLNKNIKCLAIYFIININVYMHSISEVASFTFLVKRDCSNLDNAH